MTRNKQLILGALIAITTMATLVIPRVAGDGDILWRTGVGLTVDSRWIAVEGFYSVRDRGTAARDQAWAGEALSRGATHTRSVRLSVVPNLIERFRRNLVIMRTLGRAAFTVARHLVRTVIDGWLGRDTREARA